MRESDRYNTSEIQDALLSLMKKIHTLFEENNIKYSLSGGSMLGAIRHNGFIPWDDDMDIMVDRENFNKIIKTVANNDDFVLERDIWVYRIKSKTLIGNSYIPTIDIFVVDNAPDNKLLWKTKVLLIKMLQGSLKEKQDLKKYSFVYRICIVVTYALGRLFSDTKKYEWYNNISQWGNNSKTKYVSTYNNLFKVVNICYESKTMNELELHKFEDTELYITKAYDSYLTKQYGDYMIPVREEDRVPQHR